jgi:hypothetical protein
MADVQAECCNDERSASVFADKMWVYLDQVGALRCSGTYSQVPALAQSRFQPRQVIASITPVFSFPPFSTLGDVAILQLWLQCTERCCGCFCVIVLAVEGALVGDA